jgi:uncharacterized protein (TIGR03437 family)
MPLHLVSPGQINALAPYGLPKNVPLELIVRRAGRLSAPRTVTIAAAAPGIFTIDSSGKGRGLLPDASFRLAGAANPLQGGQVGILLATGLGDVDPPPAEGQQTAQDIRSTVLPVKVREAANPRRCGSPACSPDSPATTR